MRQFAVFAAQFAAFVVTLHQILNSGSAEHDKAHDPQPRSLLLGTHVAWIYKESGRWH